MHIQYSACVRHDREVTAEVLTNAYLQDFLQSVWSRICLEYLRWGMNGFTFALQIHDIVAEVVGVFVSVVATLRDSAIALHVDFSLVGILVFAIFSEGCDFKDDFSREVG